MEKSGNQKQPYFIYHRDNETLFFMSIGKPPYDREHGQEGFVIVTAASNEGMVDIHDRRPLVLKAGAVREWLSQETSPARAAEIAHDSVLSETDFTWHPVAAKVGNVHNQGPDIIRSINDS